MASELLLGLDLGTQAVKGILVSVEGEVLCEASVERSPKHPQPGWTEMDAEQDWWFASVRVIRELLASNKGISNSIRAIGVTALACCLCPLDEYGWPLRSAILYSDNRAIRELDWVNQNTGLNLSAEAVVPKLVWLQRHEPEEFRRMAVTVTANGYVVYRLTNKLSMDYDNASIMGGIFDPLTHQWKENVLTVLNLPVSIWPPPLPATGIVGGVSAEAAQITGLKSGTPVIAGTGDTFPTIVGCGAINPGDAMISFGTTGLLTLTVRPLVEAVEGPHFQSDSSLGAVKWGANVLSAGRMVQWFREQFAHAERLVAGRTKVSEFLILEDQARLVNPGSDGLIILPHFLGRRTPRLNPYLRGAILGLTPFHTSAHIYRSLLEAFAFNIRQGYDVLRDSIERTVVTAGGARSALWREIVSNVLNARLLFHPKSSGALGIAFLAGYATGLKKDFAAINQKWLQDPVVTEPDPEIVELYDHLFKYYCKFDEALEEPFLFMGKEKSSLV